MGNSANLSYPKSCSWVIMLSWKRSSELLFLPPPPCTTYCIFLNFTCYFYHSCDHWIFFMQPFSQPSLPLCQKMQYLQGNLPPPCFFWVTWDTLINTNPTTGYSSYSSYWWPVYRKNYHLFLHSFPWGVLILKKGSGTETVLKLLHSERKSRNHWQGGLAFY